MSVIEHVERFLLVRSWFQ